MARDRQKAKQRQADRRAARLAREAEASRGAPAVTGDPEQDALLAAGAPPQDEGTTKQVVSHEPPPIPDLDDAELEAEAARAPTEAGLTSPPAETHERGRVIGFLIAVWAELQRVEWPDRQALTTMTGVVVGFVIIAGGYLGVLDAAANWLVQLVL
jgi:preprotein translocase SecE subunit